MRSSIILILFNLLMVLPAQAQGSYKIGPADTRVEYSGSEKIFPCKWRNKKTKPVISPVDQGEVSRTNSALQKALDRYPAELLKKNLKRVYVVKTMSFFGLEYGGTYHKRKIYITSNGTRMGYSEAFLQGLFHHEFSSILLKRHTAYFDREGWHACNPADFEYGQGGKEALANAEAGIQADPGLFPMGFINQYAMASEEEDFNTYAQFLFRSDPVFWQAWEEHPAIRNKTRLLISFLHQLHPCFTLEYFRQP